MKYIINERIFSISNRFKIKGLDQRDYYEVVGKIFSLGKKLDFYDNSGKKLLRIEEKLFKIFKEYSIKQDGRKTAKIKQKISLLKPKYSIDSIYGDYTIKGDVFKYNFSILKDGRTVAKVSKKLISLSDKYTVDIDDSEDQVFILALVIILDQIHHDGLKSNSNSSSNTNNNQNI